MKELAAALAVVLVAGCQSPPLSPEQVAALDYGPKPTDYEDIVRDYLKPRLNEPKFALIEFKAGPSRLYQGDTLSRERQYGWAVCVTINERDSWGVYTFFPMVVYIREGKVVAADGGILERSVGLRYAHAQCGKLGHEVL